MVKLIMGLKGSGKTKQLVDLIAKAVEEETGSIVCIEKGKNLTYDIPYSVRLIHAGDYAVGSVEFFKGLISGIHAGNYDICHVFIDNFFKIVEFENDQQIAEMLGWLEAFSVRENVRFTISATRDIASATEEMKQYF